jgi:integrase
MPTRLKDDWLKEQVPPSTGSKWYGDTEIKGFGARHYAPTSTSPGGRITFAINYYAEGVERRFRIGEFPTWSATAARAEAKELRRRIDRGEDPADDKRARREAPTVKDLAERYRAEHLPGKAPRSQRDDWAMINNEILPALGDRKVADVHDGDISALHGRITARGAPVRANRVLAVLSKMFALCLRRCEGEDAAWRTQAQGNPCQGVGRNREEGKERFFSPRELAALGDALVEYGNTPAADCIRFIMLTGCRPGEAMAATWDQVDIEPGSWVKPSAHTKQRKVHRVPLGAAGLELLDRLRKSRDGSPRRSRSDFIFPGQSHGEPLKQLRSTWETVSEAASVALWRESDKAGVSRLIADLTATLRRPPFALEVRELAAKAGITLPPAPDDARIYDLRHSFATTGVTSGLTLPIIGRLLGHTQVRTTARYAHVADDPLRDAAQKISAQIAGAGKKLDNVEQLRKGRI